MSTLEQILCWSLWLFNTVGVMGLIVYVIHVHRESHKKHDTATQERRTIIDRIERLRAEGRTNNYIFFNSKRHAVLATWKAQLGKEGLPVPSEPPDMTKLKESRGARVVMIAVETGAGSFLEALQ